ncbi:MAG: hypothetical protein CVV10_03625, partial [Gammaproteobacteria bacterium HGW-Gammaproteobacteria-14]
SAVSADCGLFLPRAGFADNVVDREPVGSGHQAAGRLWFFTEVAEGTGETLQHQWYRNGAEDALIRLPVGAASWRTWSSRQIEDGSQYSVRVTTASGCDLGEYALTDHEPARIPPQTRQARSQNLDQLSSDIEKILSEAHDALAKQDIPGARLHIRLAQENGNNSPALQRFLEQELALAELAREVDNDNLYLASGRIERLASQPLSGASLVAFNQLKQRWSQRREELHQETRGRLMALQRSLNTMPATVNCEAPVVDSLWLPEPEAQWLSVTEQQANAGLQILSLFDQRTGMLHQVERPCRQL